MKIVVIERRDIIKGVSKAWDNQYRTYGCERKTAIGERLKDLDLKTCSAKDVDEVIGNGSWTTNACDLCGEENERLLRIGDDPDYEARFVDICGTCLDVAKAKLEKL